jgi:ABC-type phosphate transport system substrate-binding protein
MPNFPNFTQDIGADPALSLPGAGAGTFNGTQTSSAGRGVRAAVTISNVSGTISVVANLQVFDPTSGVWTTLLSSIALTGAGTTLLTVYPEITAVANSISQNHPGEWFRVQLVSGTGSSPSFNSKVGYCILG